MDQCDFVPGHFFDTAAKQFFKFVERGFGVALFDHGVCKFVLAKRPDVVDDSGEKARDAV